MADNAAVLSSLVTAQLQTLNALAAMKEQQETLLALLSQPVKTERDEKTAEDIKVIREVVQLTGESLVTLDTKLSEEFQSTLTRELKKNKPTDNTDVLRNLVESLIVMEQSITTLTSQNETMMKNQAELAKKQDKLEEVLVENTARISSLDLRMSVVGQEPSFDDNMESTIADLQNAITRIQ